MFIKVLVINGVIISAILGTAYFGQLKNSKTFVHDIYGKTAGQNEYAQKTENWLNDVVFQKAKEEAEKRQGIATESVVEATQNAKKGLMDAIWDASVGNAQRGISGIGEALNGGKESVSEKISETFCPAPEEN